MAGRRTHAFVSTTKKIRLESRKGIVKLSLAHLSSRLVNGSDGFRAPEVQVIGTDSDDRAIALVRLEQLLVNVQAVDVVC